MADRVAGIHDKFNGDLDVKIAEIHELMRGMAVDDPPPTWTASPEIWSQGLKKKNTGSNANSTYSPDHIDLDQYNFPRTPGGGRSPVLSGTEKFSPRSSKGSSKEGASMDIEGRWPSATERPCLPSVGLSPVLQGSEFPSRSSKASSREGIGRDIEGRRAPSPAERPRLSSVSEASPRFDSGGRDTAFTDSDGRRLRSYNPYVHTGALTETSHPNISHLSPVPSFGMSISASSYATPATSLSPSLTPYANSAAPSYGVSPSNTPQIPPRSSQRPSVTNMSYTSARTANGTSAAQRVSSGTTHSYPLSLESSQRMSQNSAYYETSSLPSMLPSPVIPPFQEAQPLHSNSLISPFPPVQEDPIEQDSPFKVASDDEQALFERELTRDSATLCEA